MTLKFSEILTAGSCSGKFSIHIRFSGEILRKTKLPRISSMIRECAVVRNGQIFYFRDSTPALCRIFSTTVKRIELDHTRFSVEKQLP